MKKNKIFITISLVIIIFVSLFIAWAYIDMRGLPWKVKQTEITARKYLSEKYPNLKYTVDKSYYNSKFGYYSCNVNVKGDLPISFQVTVKDKESIKDNYFQMKINAEAKYTVINLVKNIAPNIEKISVLADAGANAVEENYEKHTSFTPERAYPLKIDIIWNGDKMSLDSFVDKALSIRQILQNKNISVCGLYIQDSTNGYVIDLNGRLIKGKMEGNYNFTKDEIIKNKSAYKID